MKDIKTRNRNNINIKTFDKSKVLADKFKNNILSVKNNTESINSNESQYQYGNEKIKNISVNSSNALIDKENKIGKKAFNNTKTNFRIIKNKLINKKIKNELIIKQNNNNIKKSKKIINSSVNAIKALLAASKVLLSAIIAGGWLLMIIIIIICLIGLLCASPFGIFFSNDTKGKTITKVIRETNAEVYKEIENIKNSSKYVNIEVKSTYSNWNEILAVYSVKYSEEGKYDITIIDKKNESNLKKVFWDFNEIKYDIKNGNITSEGIEKDIKIYIESKKVDEIMNNYNFTDKEKELVNELLSDNYKLVWNNVIYGSLKGNYQIVEVAKQQVGNIGGEPYWRWYGYDERVEWCAIFVSWVAEQVGLIQKNIIPKTAGVEVFINWFKLHGEWQERGYIPRPGDIIFFDWELDGIPNHVGIVESYEDGMIYTIEGNSSGDQCREQDYSINSNLIYGFGVPEY